jgi:hypothetical protein
MYADIGQKSNTMIFSEKPGDVNALLAQAAAVISGGASAAIPQQRNAQAAPSISSLSDKTK